MQVMQFLICPFSSPHWWLTSFFFLLFNQQKCNLFISPGFENNFIKVIGLCYINFYWASYCDRHEIKSHSDQGPDKGLVNLVEFSIKLSNYKIFAFHWKISLITKLQNHFHVRYLWCKFIGRKSMKTLDNCSALLHSGRKNPIQPFVNVKQFLYCLVFVYCVTQSRFNVLPR